MNKKELWDKTIWAVNEAIRDIRDIIDTRTVKLGFYAENRDSVDYGLSNMCGELQSEILDLYDKISDIRTSCRFLKDETFIKPIERGGVSLAIIQKKE